jgi:TetR/AcrR family transcriptional repressor of bet genes
VGVPKRVDHQERRQQIADAVCRLAGREGLEGVSLRHVATEAGISMGRVQHYFATKDEMLMFTFQAISERVEQRMAAAVSGLEQSGDPKSLLRAMLVEMLPLSQQARAEAPVLVAFLARIIIEPNLADPLSKDIGRLNGFVAEHIIGAQQNGAASAELDPVVEAATLLALIDGLMIHLLTHQVAAPAALAALDGQLDRIFPAR